MSATQPQNAVFISDVHIMGLDDPRMDPFAAFLRSWIGRTDLVVLLGDIFDFYYGFRGVVFWEHTPVLAAMRDLVQGGVRVVFVEGNHEFRIAEACAGFGVEALPGIGDVEVAGTRIYLAHGDRADPKDYGYRFLYRFLRNPIIATLANILPASWAWRIARMASDSSRAYKGGRGEALNRLFRGVAETQIAGGFDAALFGHSHQPELERILAGDREGWFGNCGDWVRHRTFIRFDGREFHLEEGPETVPRLETAVA